MSLPETESYFQKKARLALKYYDEAMSKIDDQFTSQSQKKDIISDISRYYDDVLRDKLRQWVKENNLEKYDTEYTPLFLSYFKKAAIARFVNCPIMPEVQVLLDAVEKVRAAPIVKKQTKTESTKQKIEQIINKPLLKELFNLMMDGLKEFDQRLLETELAYFLEIHQNVIDAKKNYKKEQGSYSDVLRFAAKGDSNLSVVNEKTKENVISFVTRSCEDRALTRNLKIAQQLEKEKINSLVSNKVDARSDGFDGFFTIETNKGQKTVKINTIYAGGYHIQRAHLRVLVTIR